MSRKHRILVTATLVLLVAAFLRFHSLEVQSFWNDEGNSARLSERSTSAILEGTASDIHPPLYYLILRGWRELVGDTEFGLRSFSAFAGVMVVAATLALGMVITGRRPIQVSLIAGLLAAVSPVMVYYSQETRMYMLLALIAGLSTWVLLVWISRRLGGAPSFLWAMGYVLLLTAGLYSHYFFPAVMMAQAVIVLVSFFRPQANHLSQGGVSIEPQPQRAGRHILVWGGMALLAAGLYLPWVPIFLRQIGGRPGGTADLLAFLTESNRWLLLGSTVRVGEATWALLAGFSLILLGIIAGGRRAVIPLLMALLPMGFMAVAGATDPAYFKFLLVVVPFICVLMGLAWRLTGWKQWVPVSLALILIVGSAQSLINMYTDPAFARADYRGMAQRIRDEAYPNAGVILNAPNQWEAFTYYFPDIQNVYPLPRGRPDPAILEPELTNITAAYDRLYALFWGEGQRDPQRVVERWLDANTFKVSEEWVGDVRFAVYSIPHDMTAVLKTSEARFISTEGSEIRLDGFAVWPSQPQPGDIVQVQLIWSSPDKISRAYKIFIHLLDAEGRLVAQRDSEPVGGSRPTTSWEPGEAIVDNYGLVLPADLPPGQYTLRLGFYDPQDPAKRLLVQIPDRAGEYDGLTLETFIVP